MSLYINGSRVGGLGSLKNNTTAKYLAVRLGVWEFLSSSGQYGNNIYAANLYNHKVTDNKDLATKIELKNRYDDNNNTLTAGTIKIYGGK